MSTSAVDLSSLQGIDFGGGQSGFYDPSSGSYFDSGGNPLSASDLAQYGSFTVTSPGASAPPPPAGSGGVIQASGSGGSLSGLSGLFSGIGAAIVNATRSPTITTKTGSTLVYNPATGGYTTQSALTASSALNPLVLLVLGAAIIWFAMREAHA